MFFYGASQVEGRKMPGRHSEVLAMLRDLGLRTSPESRVVEGVDGSDVPTTTTSAGAEVRFDTR